MRDLEEKHEWGMFPPLLNYLLIRGKILLIGTLYLLRNKINDRKYIGKTYKSLEERFKEHIKASRKEVSKNRDLYKAFNFFGHENFEMIELGCYEQGVLEEKETEYIIKYNTYKNGYNQTLGGDGKRYIEETDEELIELYYKLGTVKAVAEYTNHSSKWISKILKNNGVNICHNGRKQIMINENGLVFDDQINCARWLVENNLVGAKSIKNTSTSIRRVLKGERKQYCGFTFSLVD